MLPDNDKRYAIETRRSSEKCLWFKINDIQLVHLLVVWYLVDLQDARCNNKDKENLVGVQQINTFYKLVMYKADFRKNQCNGDTYEECAVERVVKHQLLFGCPILVPHLKTFPALCSIVIFHFLSYGFVSATLTRYL